MLRIGLPRDHPAVAKALRYLLAQQQDFGGWFQTTTHENFRTPMRETRYAVMALAEAFPRPGRPAIGWGNRDERPGPLAAHRFARPHARRPGKPLGRPRAGSGPVRHGDRRRCSIIAEPLVRAAAAACLGRLGQAESVTPLVGRLADPSKIVWRAAAWALRRLGNQGLGMDAIAAALESPNPPIRRGAARIFAYQFQGWTTGSTLADSLDRAHPRPRSLDAAPGAPDACASGSTARTTPRFARRIVDTYLARMAEPDVPVVRKNLSEGLYIMLDENLGGGVSLQKNIAELPGGDAAADPGGPRGVRARRAR